MSGFHVLSTLMCYWTVTEQSHIAHCHQIIGVFLQQYEYRRLQAYTSD